MINITYRFTFPGTSDNKISYRMGLDENDYTYHCYEKESLEINQWAALDFHQCKNCTLDINIYPLCPIAKNLNKQLPHLLIWDHLAALKSTLMACQLKMYGCLYYSLRMEIQWIFHYQKMKDPFGRPCIIWGSSCKNTSRLKLP